MNTFNFDNSFNLYLECTKKSGGTTFFNLGYPYVYLNQINIKPEVGKFLMFPSWLQHMVYPFEGEGERRTVAANLNVWRISDDGTRH